MAVQFFNECPMASSYMATGVSVDINLGSSHQVDRMRHLSSQCGIISPVTHACMASALKSMNTVAMRERHDVSKYVVALNTGRRTLRDTTI